MISEKINPNACTSYYIKHVPGINRFGHKSQSWYSQDLRKDYTPRSFVEELVSHCENTINSKASFVMMYLDDEINANLIEIIKDLGFECSFAAPSHNGPKALRWWFAKPEDVVNLGAKSLEVMEQDSK